jgi:hypothetical protein
MESELGYIPWHVLLTKGGWALFGAITLVSFIVGLVKFGVFDRLKRRNKDAVQH